MRKEYDRDRAAQLVPLLRSITREILERTAAIERLELASMQGAATPDGGAGVEADLVGQRRELRLAKQELARLGCAIDQDHPLRVLIPGTQGQAGFAWSVDDPVPQPITLASSR